MRGCCCFSRARNLNSLSTVDVCGVGGVGGRLRRPSLAPTNPRLDTCEQAKPCATQAASGRICTSEALRNPSVAQICVRRRSLAQEGAGALRQSLARCRARGRAGKALRGAGVALRLTSKRGAQPPRRGPAPGRTSRRGWRSARRGRTPRTRRSCRRSRSRRTSTWRSAID